MLKKKSLVFVLLLAILSVPAWAQDSNYIAAQSGVFSGLAGTFANLNDNSGTTGAGTNNNAQEWINATFPSAVAVNAVTVGGGSLAGWGAVAQYLNNRQIQHSADGTNWNTVATISGVEDSGANQFRTFSFSPVTARFWRILSSGWLATTEFRFSVGGTSGTTAPPAGTTGSTSPPVISLNASSGQTGARVEVRGNLPLSGNTLHVQFPGGERTSLGNLPSNGTAFTFFAVTSLNGIATTPGIYTLWVSNANGVSNQVIFTLLGGAVTQNFVTDFVSCSASTLESMTFNQSSYRPGEQGTADIIINGRNPFVVAFGISLSGAASSSTQTYFWNNYQNDRCKSRHIVYFTAGSSSGRVSVSLGHLGEIGSGNIQIAGSPVPGSSGTGTGAGGATGTGTGTATTLSPGLSCATENSATGTTLLRIENRTGGAAELPSQSTYNNFINCRDVAGGTLTTGSGTTALRLSSETNAHVQSGRLNNFRLPIMLGSSRDTINCDYRASCDGFQTCVASISSAENGHIAACGVLPLQVCCTIGQPAAASAASTITSPTPSDFPGRSVTVVHTENETITTLRTGLRCNTYPPQQVTTYTRRTSGASGSVGVIITCDGADTRLSCQDVGTGRNRHCDESGTNGCRAWEGSNNRGEPACLITCRSEQACVDEGRACNSTDALPVSQCTYRVTLNEFTTDDIGAVIINNSLVEDAAADDVLSCPLSCASPRQSGSENCRQTQMLNRDITSLIVHNGTNTINLSVADRGNYSRGISAVFEIRDRRINPETQFCVTGSAVSFCSNTDTSCGARTCQNCNAQDGWHNTSRNVFACENGVLHTMLEEEFRDFRCGNRECIFGVTQRRLANVSSGGSCNISASIRLAPSVVRFNETITVETTAVSQGNLILECSRPEGLLCRSSPAPSNPSCSFRSPWTDTGNRTILCTITGNVSAQSSGTSSTAGTSGSPSSLGSCPSAARDIPSVQLNQQYTCSCSASQTQSGSIWGTNIYTDDSNLCRAALHAGRITSSGGTVTLTVIAGQNSYSASTQNGITSSSFGSWTRSFQFATGSGTSGSTSVNYIAGQSSVFTGLSGTFANLNDSNGQTGAATNNNAQEWINATFPSAVTVNAVTVGGGNLPNGWGAVAQYLNNRQIQHSADGTNWNTVVTITGVEDSGPNQFRTFSFPQATARFWRILSNGWLASTEFRFSVLSSASATTGDVLPFLVPQRTVRLADVQLQPNFNSASLSRVSFQSAATDTGTGSQPTVSSTSTFTLSITSDNTAPSVLVNGSPSSFQEQDAVATILCSDTFQCSQNSLRLLVSFESMPSCPRNYSLYDMQPPKNISRHAFACAAALDIAGNSGFSDPAEFRVLGTNLPVTNITSPANGSVIGTNFTVSITDTAPVGGLSLCEYRIRSNGEISRNWSTRDCNAALAVSIGESSLCRTGTCMLEARARDVVGREGYDGRAEYTIDTARPEVAFTAPAAGIWQTRNFTVSIRDTFRYNITTCQYRILSGSTETQAWTNRTCSSDVPVSVGQGMNCRNSGANSCRVEARAIGATGTTGSADRSFSIDLSGNRYDFASLGTTRFEHTDTGVNFSASLLSTVSLPVFIACSRSSSIEECRNSYSVSSQNCGPDRPCLCGSLSTLSCDLRCNDYNSTYYVIVKGFSALEERVIVGPARDFQCPSFRIGEINRIIADFVDISVRGEVIRQQLTYLMEHGNNDTREGYRALRDRVELGLGMINEHILYINNTVQSLSVSRANEIIDRSREVRRQVLDLIFSPSASSLSILNVTVPSQAITGSNSSLSVLVRNSGGTTYSYVECEFRNGLQTTRSSPCLIVGANTTRSFSVPLDTSRGRTANVSCSVYSSPNTACSSAVVAAFAPSRSLTVRPVVLSIESITPPGNMIKGEEAIVTMTVKNSGEAEQTAYANCTFIDPLGDRFHAVTESQSLQPQETRTFFPKLQVRTAGAWQLSSCSVHNADGSFIEAQRSVGSSFSTSERRDISECSLNANCPGTNERCYCSSGSCQACTEGTRCVNHQCLRVECTADADCAAGRACQESRCVAGVQLAPLPAAQPSITPLLVIVLAIIILVPTGLYIYFKRIAE